MFKIVGMKINLINAFLCFVIVSTFISCTTMYGDTRYEYSKIGASDYAGFFEVTVSDWMTYIVTSKFRDTTKKAAFDKDVFLGDHIEEIKELMPDLTIPGWSNYFFKAFFRKTNKNKSFSIYDYATKGSYWVTLPKSAYDSIHKYRLLDLPVIGITKQQAFDYCQWQDSILKKDGFLSTKKVKFTGTYQCYLPSPGQFDSLQTKIDSANSLKCPLFNFKNCLCIDCPGVKHYRKHPIFRNVGKQPVLVSNFFPDGKYGLWNIKGNVAEMTSSEGIAKGGSCNHYASEAYNGNSQEYTKPEFWLGFRVWCRVYPK